MQILLVEDEESLRITLAANLELEGHGVVEAPDAQSALALLGSVKVDVVLSDVRMPGLGGVELLRRVRASDPDLPVVLMTAYTAEEQLDAALLAGVFTVLKKPFDIGAAVRVMTRAVTGPVVLVVDDDPALATSGIEALRRAGLRAEVVLNGEEALESIETGRFDVCVTDLTMPGMAGATLMRKLREKCPTICLKKPVSPRDLLRSLARTRGGAFAV